MLNIYQSVYDLIVNYLFGGSVDVASNQELIAMLLSSCATIFVFSIPFIICWKVIKVFLGG